MVAFSFLSWRHQGSSMYYIDDGIVATSTHIWKAEYVQYVAIQWRNMSPLDQDATYFSKMIDLRRRNLTPGSKCHKASFINFGSGNGLAPSGNKLLLEAMLPLTSAYAAIWLH